MQRSPYTATQTFRCTQQLAEAIQALADKQERHTSEIIRAAVAYCLTHPSCLDEQKASFR